MGTIGNEATPSSDSDSPSRYDQFIERFLRDDGSICLGFLVLAFSIHKGIEYLKKRFGLGMSVASQSSDSSSGLSSTSTTNTNTSSGLGSMSSETNGKAMSKSSKVSPGVPLSRAALCVLLVSVLGFLWGQQLSDNEGVSATVGSIASLVGLGQKLPTSTPLANVATESMDDSNTSAILQGYVKEQKEREFSLPTFATEAEKAMAKAKEASSLKRFVEFIVHPPLLTIGDEAEKVAIAVSTDSQNGVAYDGIELAEAMVWEIMLYKEVEEITILLVSSEAASKEGCPPELSLEKAKDINVVCVNVDPSIGRQKENGDLGKKLGLAKGVDISINLSGCNAEYDDRLWEDGLYDYTEAIVSSCSAPMRPFGRSLTTRGWSDQETRLEFIEEFFTKSNYDGRFTKSADYDVQGLNMVFGFVDNKDARFDRWHLNEALYNFNLKKRLKGDSRDTSLLYFEAAEMAMVEFPSRQSAESYCAYAKENTPPEEHDDELHFCNFPFNPNFPNIPNTDLYVDKSTSGENAGRGVFTSVDIPTIGTFIALEESVHRVDYHTYTKDIILDLNWKPLNEPHGGRQNDDDDDDDDDEDDEDDEDDDIFSEHNTFGKSELLTNRIFRSTAVYMEAYGFDADPWGKSQSTVYTNVGTFVNHGCNGTANIEANVEGQTEFTMDVDDPNFVIPEEFASFEGGLYTPHRDRCFHGFQAVSKTHYHVAAGDELFDNYITFGGDSYFAVMVKDIRRDCSGGLGTVELQQAKLKEKEAAAAKNNEGSSTTTTSTKDDEESPAGGSDEL